MIRLLAATAVLVSLTAIVVSARTVDRAARSGSRPPEGVGIPAASPSPPPRWDRDPARGIERIASTYALTARTWSSRTLVASWLRQRELATGRYRSALERARPTRTQRDELRSERASNVAFPAAKARARVDGRRAQVDVALHERTATGGQVAARRTRNRVSLRHVSAGWRVTGWTILSGGDR